MVTKGAIQVNIGANPSAEGEDADEAPADDGSYQVNNVIDAFNLEQTSFDKKSFLAYIKGYLKVLKARIEERNPAGVAEFEKNAQGYVKKMLDKFSDLEFYTGESMNPEAMVVAMGYREDGKTPYLIYWKDGMRAEKY